MKGKKFRWQNGTHLLLSIPQIDCFNCFNHIVVILKDCTVFKYFGILTVKSNSIFAYVHHILNKAHLESFLVFAAAQSIAALNPFSSLVILEVEITLAVPDWQIHLRSEITFLFLYKDLSSSNKLKRKHITSSF